MIWSTFQVITATAPAAPPRVSAFATPPVIDGVLAESAWAGAARLEHFVQTQPGDNIAPSRATRVLLGFDARTLYLAIEAEDDSSLVRATVARRDGILADDNACLLLDTFGSRHRAYVLCFNPLGIQQDGVFTEGTDSTDYSVDVVMQSAGRVHAHGWTVEIAIPLSSLRYAIGLPWNLQVQRRIKHLDNEQDSWMPMRRGATGFLTQAGSVTGFDQLPARGALEVIPSVTALQAGQRVAPAGLPDDYHEQAARADVGLSATWTPSPDVSAALALNPDFAQVESDAPVVVQNQRFPILYEEKRPFFLEGIDLFRTPLTVVHTRAIVDPIGAVKLTGKRGRTSFGLLAASDEAPGHYSAAEQADTSLAPVIAAYGGHNSTALVARVQREIFAASNVGLLATGYHFVDRSNLTAGTDGRLAFGPWTSFTFQLTGTWAHQPFYDPASDSAPVRDGYGLGYSSVLRRTGRHLNVALVGKGRSKDWVADVGFTAQRNTNSWYLEARWDGEQHPGATLISWSAANTVLAQFDWDGRMTYAYVWPRASFTLPRLTSFTVGPYADYLRLFEEEFGAKRGATQPGAFAGAPERSTVYNGFAITGTTTPGRRWTLTENLDWSWKAFDYDFGGGPKYPRVSPAALSDPNAPLDPGTGATFDATIALALRPFAALRLDASWTKSRLRRKDTRLVAYNEDLWTGQAVYQLSHFASVRLRADYSKSFSTLRPQLLLAWTPNPGTAIYAGYNDDLATEEYNAAIGSWRHVMQRNARTVFFKVSYLVRRTFS